MGVSEEPKTPEAAAPGPLLQPSKDTATLTTIALCLVIAATSWFLLKELAALLRPLLLAVFLAYVILPIHHRLRQRMSNPTSILVMAGGTMAILYLLALVVYASVIDLNDDLPSLTARAQHIYGDIQDLVGENLPWLIDHPGEPKLATGTFASQLQQLARQLVNVAAGALVDALVVGFYLLFLLMEAGRFPQRVRRAFPLEQREEILATVQRINEAIAGYLRVKVKASLILAAPVTLVLWVFNVKFALLWGVLTFLCNFIPYLGSITAVTLPLVMTFLDLDFGWRPIAVAVLIIGIHMLMTYLVEPSMIGRQVGLSPLVILLALTFWGLCWGLIGMFLAIPLTVVLKLVLEHIAFTQPLARLLGED
jgi:AI-2 transport protein TqsA